MVEREFEDHRGLIDKLGGPSLLYRQFIDDGSDIGSTTVQSWHLRNNIPDKYWVRLQKIHKRTTGREITFEDLIETAARNLAVKKRRHCSPKRRGQ